MLHALTSLLSTHTEVVLLTLDIFLYSDVYHYVQTSNYESEFTDMQQSSLESEKRGS